MNANCIVGILVSLMVATTATGQQPLKKDTPPPIRAVAVFRNGSKWVVIVLPEKITVATKFGKQDIPFSEIQKIDFAPTAKDNDTIQAAFPVKGHIAGDAFEVYSPIFGNKPVKFSDLKSLYTGHGREYKIELDALKYGSDTNQWLETGVMIRPNTRLQITADGQVDLWPQQPGQYMVGPKGYTTAGKGGIFMAGALIGRIGSLGKAFLVGENCECAPSEEGTLYLQIVASPWNNTSSGSHVARITTSYKIGP